MGRKTSKNSEKNVISDFKHGCLKMLDFEIMDKALKIAWIKRLTVHDDAPWKIIPEFATTEYGGLSFLIECRYDVKHLSLDNLPLFTTLYLSIGKNITTTNLQKTLISKTK